MAVKEFSVEEKLVALVRLQKINSKLDEIQILKGELPMEVKDLEDDLFGLKERQTRIEEEINGISEYIAAAKVRISESQALVKKYEKQSNEVKNSREFDAINSEIETQILIEKRSEKNIKEATDDIAKKVEKLELTKKAIAAKEGNLEVKKGELEKIIKDTEKEEKHYHKDLDEARAQVDERLLHSYDRIRNNFHNGLAIVHIERDSCGGCFHSIPPQKQSEIRLHKKVMACENCGRILVDDELFDKIAIK